MSAVAPPLAATAAAGCDPPAQKPQEEIITVNPKPDLTMEEDPAAGSYPVLVQITTASSSSLADGMPMLLMRSDDSLPGSLQGVQAPLQLVPATASFKDAGAAPTTQHQQQVKRESAARELRGWLMVLATVVASITYASGLSPPGGFQRLHAESSSAGAVAATVAPPPPHLGASFVDRMMPVLRDVSPTRYRTFYYSNTAAFALSLSIVLLLASHDLRKLAKLKALEALVGMDVLALLVAYIAGSTFSFVELVACVGLVLIVPLALVLMSSRLCGKFFWDEL
ncbi:uncharacterized protein LOC112269529 [Brachypodium distachyon]|uniref:PGG domain-containing protein n=1 Tax=Brachypodium distachyon TaxID=15368 RepID=I1IWK5_BRADI|nr:uncharacterized protein LOC112269529 [Brachypodium distachyon]PNT60781.1 hypothetical protein BRADI_5g04740v3 [Brachypodium distachyon]PNT60782.1 hypothetical protein BRADI_5g04740v3 [Brachypodium distachyon]|eukprot:XP_024312192.1 uncharacterized protein LOC112269529 [Brachypodium distachyon]